MPPGKPGIVPLRPLSPMELYDGAFQAVRSNPGALIGASAVVVVIVYAVTTTLQLVAFGPYFDALDRVASSPEDVGSVADLAAPLTGVGTAALVSGVLQFLATTLLSGVVTLAVSTAVLGRRTPLRELWGRLRPRLGALLGSSVLVALVLVLAVVVCLAPGAGVLVPAFTGADESLLATGAVLVVLGVLAALAAVLVLGTRLSLTTPAVVLEGQPVVQGLRRSWRLTHRGFWRLLGVRLLALVGLQIVSAVLVGPFTVLGMVVASAVSDGPSGTAYALASTIPAAVGGALAATVVYPLTAAVIALQYVDQRMRLEGLDVELARAAGA